MIELKVIKKHITSPTFYEMKKEICLSFTKNQTGLSVWQPRIDPVSFTTTK